MEGLYRKIDNRFVHDLQKYQPATFYKLNEYKNGYLYNMLKQNIECGIQQELFRKDFDVDVIVKFFLESLSVISNTSIFPSGKYNTKQVTEEVFKHFLNGLLTLKGQKEIHHHS
jgi:TetR/AcrR family transcriptional regulator, cholesterol catabolism regulator